MLEIRRAMPEEYPRVRTFYHQMIDDMQEMTYKPGWQKEVYPSDGMLKEALNRGELYVGELGVIEASGEAENERTGAGEKRIASAMVVNHEYNESYENYKWQTLASKEEILVIHALGVAPAYMGRGFAKQMVEYVTRMGRKNGQKAIRLDVLKGNVPAERLYPSVGFTYLHTLPMYYEDTGWTDFLLYEKVLQ